MNEESYASKEQELAREILHYLQNYPDAMDTIEGIAGWWLHSSSNLQMLSNVKVALHFLLSKNFVVETRRAGLPPYYRVNDSKHKEISKFLEGT